MRNWEIEWPGRQVKLEVGGGQDYPAASEIERLLNALEITTVDATIVLDLFEKAYAGFVASYQETMREREREHQTEGDPVELPRAELLAERERHEQRVFARKYDMHRPSVLAEAFVYLVDRFGKLLKALHGKLKILPVDLLIQSKIGALHKDFEATFPNIVGLRDSCAHMDERFQGKARRVKIDVKPATAEPFFPGSTALLLGVMSGTKFIQTLEDGTQGELDVSRVSLNQMQRIFLATLYAFEWR